MMLLATLRVGPLDRGVSVSSALWNSACAHVEKTGARKTVGEKALREVVWAAAATQECPGFAGSLQHHLATSGAFHSHWLRLRRHLLDLL
jgi:hypothetical protein